MRKLKVAEEAAHETARKWETARPDKSRALFDLSRQAFQLHQAMQRSWPAADEARRTQLLGAAETLLQKIHQNK